MKSLGRLLSLSFLLATLPAFPTGATTFVVAIPGFDFRPTNLTINVGDSVLWTNRHTSAIHDTTHGIASTPAGSRLWTSGDLSAGGPAFTFTFNNAGYFPYICKRHVVDNAQAPQQTGSVTVTTANLPPTVHFATPSPGQSFQNSSVTITANAADTNGALTKVEIFNRTNTLLGSFTSPPFTIIARDLPFGSNILTAVATDNLGLSTTSSPVNIYVTNFARTNIVTFVGNSFNPQTVTVAAGSLVIWSNSPSSGVAHTATGEPTSLEPLCGAAVNIIGSVRCTNRFMTPGVYPYFCSIHQPSMRGTVVVLRALSTPIATLTRPSSGGQFFAGSPIAFEAEATDANGVFSLEFFRDSVVSLGSDTVAPYSVSTTLAAGTYNVFARATDTLGFGVLTPSVPITVSTMAELRLISPLVDGGLMQFDLTTAEGLTYIIEHSPFLPGSWQPLATNMATGAVMRVIDPTPVLTQTQRVYRAFIKP